MKKRTIILGLILLSGAVTNLFSNPMAEILISEIFFDSGDWTIELRNDWGQDFTGWYIKTSTDSAYFKNGLDLSQEYNIITKDSMQSELLISRMGNIISLHDSNGFMVEKMVFGFDDEASICPPQSGQSINATWNSMGSVMYYLDQTPTLGFANDTLNANGRAEGFISDSLGVPIEGAKVIYNIDYNFMLSDTMFVLTDSSGYFIFENFAVLRTLIFMKEDYQKEFRRWQIFPEHISTLQPIKLSRIVTDIKEIEAPLPESVQLFQNYPNPFNPATKIKFSIPPSNVTLSGVEESHVTLKIYDILGNEITTLVNEHKPSGIYEVEFDGES